MRTSSKAARRFGTGAFALAGVVALGGAVGLSPLAHGRGLDRAAPRLTPAALFALQSRAFAEAEAEPGYAHSRSIELRLTRGQGVEAALEGAGVGADEARAAVSSLADEFDTVNTPDGRTLDVALAQPLAGPGPARLIGLSISTGNDGTLVLSRSAEGQFDLHRIQPDPESASAPGPAPAPPPAVKGEVKGSLYLSIVESGASLQDAAEALRLLSHRLDLTRDVDSGDGFRLIYDSTASVRGDGRLLYVEFSAPGRMTRLYRLPGKGGHPLWVDQQGIPLQGGLLRTPVDAIRITSGFGLRLHPILGYSRMHQGVDFGAPAGSAVYAAGDGVIEDARWAGGYGRWIRIRHEGGWETGYAHLSAFASGLAPGARVSQGQVIGYVGASGLATGPHLHFEVMKNGERLDPRTADPETPTSLAPSQRAEFDALKDRLALIDAAAANG
jgi:murein DD-endopeptidase MepM/ murein hydrolase activator NlpD